MKRLRALRKQTRLMLIGHYRHHKFTMLLLARALNSEKLYYCVRSVADEGCDAFFMEATSPDTIKVLEVYELTNFKRFLDPFPRCSGEKSMERLKSEEFRKRRERAKRSMLYRVNTIDITPNLFVDPFYLPPHTFVQLSKEAVSSHKYHFEGVEIFFGYPIKKYVIISYAENLTEHALWEYAKHSIKVKVMGYQD